MGVALELAVGGGWKVVEASDRQMQRCFEWTVGRNLPLGNTAAGASEGSEACVSGSWRKKPLGVVAANSQTASFTYV